MDLVMSNGFGTDFGGLKISIYTVGNAALVTVGLRGRLSDTLGETFVCEGREELLNHRLLLLSRDTVHHFLNRRSIFHLASRNR